VNGSQVGSTIATLTANGASNNGWGTFGNSFIIGAGKSAVVTIVADTTHTTIAADETVIAGFPAGSSNAQGTVSLTAISSVAGTGNTLTFKAGTVSVSKNAAFGDKTSANPTGPVNATQVKVGSMVIVAGAGEDVSLTQIVIEDYNATAVNLIGTSMQNLTLKDASGKQLGTTYANPVSTGTTRNAYTFNISPAVTVKNGAQFVVDVYADLKAAFSTASTPLIDVKTITASGITTGTDASVTPTAQTVPLQYTYISSAGGLMIQVDSDTPVANNYLMGATDQVLGKFKLSASSTEAISITQLVLSSRFSSGATGTLKNIRLVDDLTGAPIGSAVSSFNDTVAGSSAATGTYSHATFTGLNLQVGAGVSKTITVKGDWTTYVDSGLSTTGQTLALALRASYGGTTGSTNPITATGASSGSSITATISNYGTINNYGDFGNGGLEGGGAYTATATLYRAKLTTAWASDAPSGAASPSASQTVAKFVIMNLANAGSYIATVKKVDFDLSTTISGAAAGSSRAINVYKDSLSTTALMTTNYHTSNSANQVYDTNFTEGNFTDVDITSGASKTFYVTMDTSDAASTKSLSIRIGSSDVTWDDGLGTNLTVMGQDLPLTYKTFTY
ncbi:MAG: hypothetical protein HY983_00840, partial [Candidatus Magasanikbacteria bacterium]|nr:hypothetical protein [Candidatus Magasanikbacteria bacterium]